VSSSWKALSPESPGQARRHVRPPSRTFPPSASNCRPSCNVRLRATPRNSIGSTPPWPGGSINCFGTSAGDATSTGAGRHRTATGSNPYMAPDIFLSPLRRVAPKERAEAQRAILRSQQVRGPWILPNISRDDPLFPKRHYWRGKVWAPINWLVYHGFKTYDWDREAGLLAASSAKCSSGHGAHCGRGIDRREPLACIAVRPIWRRRKMPRSGGTPWQGPCTTSR